MSYAPNTDADRAAMARTIGVASVDALFDDIPSAYRDPVLNLPEPLPETDVLRDLRELGAENTTLDDLPSFLGAGFYRHFVPALVDQQLLRAEWYTAYTPYQAEVAQGTLQAMYEFQSMVCELTGMEVANASLYDGASALAEALLMCHAVTGRSGIIMADTVHPAYRCTGHTYVQALDVSVRTERAWRRDGDELTPDLERVAATVDGETACVVLQRPDFLGRVADPTPVIEAAQRHGAKLVYVVTDPVSLALLRPPVDLGADVVVGELRALAGDPAFGGPGAGFFATRRAHIRRVPGRIAGRTTDLEGRQGFVLTLQTREQHIRRERATSNITTNQALVALAATISLSALGPGGLRRMAEQSLTAAHRAADALRQVGATPLDGAPFWNEFPVRTPMAAAAGLARLADRGVMAGYDLGRFDPELADVALVCATELTTAADVNVLAGAWRDAFHG